MASLNGIILWRLLMASYYGVSLWRLFVASYYGVFVENSRDAIL